MTINSWPNQHDVAAFYGNPDPNGDGVPDRRWEDLNIVTLAPPWRMKLAWAPTQTIKSIRVHKLVYPSLSRVLLAMWSAFDHDQARVEAARMHLYGGAYNFRLMRGSAHLSMHSYGCAIDLDPEGNPFGGNVTMCQQARDAFAAEGWTWGGAWSKPDGMHFQGASV